MNLLIKYKFHTPMIRFIGKRDGLPPQKTTTNSGASNSFESGVVFSKQSRVLSTIQNISERSRGIINFGGIASSKDYKGVKPIDILKSK